MMNPVKISDMKRGLWEPCSATCGLGTKTWEIYCEIGGENVDLSECGLTSSNVQVDCSVMDCPPSGKFLVSLPRTNY